MRKLVVSLVVSFLFPIAAHAVQLGQPFSLTNTRYGTIPAEARLATNGSNTFMFWIANGSIRVTRLVEDVKRVGRPVLATTDTAGDSFDVIWVSDHFFVAGTNGINITGRILDAEGEPVGEEFVVNGNAVWPRLAYNGSKILMLHRGVSFNGVAALALTKNGTPAGFGGQLVQLVGESFDVDTVGNGFLAVSASFQNVLLVHFNNDGQKSSEETLEGDAPNPTVRRKAAIAAADSRYLVLWFQDQRGGMATIVDSSGHPGVHVPFATSPTDFYERPAVIWAGSDYVLAYLRRNNGRFLEVMHFSASGLPTQIEARQPADPQRGTTSLLRELGRTLLAWNPGSHPVVSELPITEAPDDVWSSYGASEQKLLAAASSSTAMLAVWSETLNDATTIRFGVRTANGDWNEHLLADHAVLNAVAASDGINFAVVTGETLQASTAYRIDSRGIASSKTTAIPFNATGISSNGQDYVIIGLQHPSGSDIWTPDVVAARMDAAGTLSPSVVVRALEQGSRSFNPAIASNGEQSLAVWKEIDDFDCPFLCIIATHVAGTRLDANLLRLDENDLPLSTSDAAVTPPAVLWNGSQYVLAWDTYLSMWTTTVTANGAIAMHVIADTKTEVGDPALARLTDGTVVVAWRDRGVGFFSNPSYAARHHLAVLRNDGTASDQIDIVDGFSPDFRLAALSASRFAYLSSMAWFDPPHHGSTRVTMRVIDRNDSLGNVPDAPTASASFDGSRVVVRWTAPAQPVTGFRIEYRVDDGSWNEVANWYAADARTAFLLLPDNTAIRVRAFNDAGMSAPSTPTQAVRQNPAKRRSVGH